MTIVTMTTDFGDKDYYVPSIKGAMLTRHRQLILVDITHQIKKHDIVEAAFTLKNCWHCFPEGTIHVISVNNMGGDRNRFLVTNYKNHYFIVPDNGLLSLIFPTLPPVAYELPFSGLSIEPIRAVLAHAVGHIVKGNPLETVGKPAGEILQRLMFQPVTSQTQIRGSVIHIDDYGNVILNITRALFERVGKNRAFKLFFKRHDPIRKLSRHYNEVSMGDTLCLFNTDYLEIAIHTGRASEMLGLKVDDTVQIEFAP
jgi:S-adenosylmethionine hydrolase